MVASMMRLFEFAFCVVSVAGFVPLNSRPSGSQHTSSKLRDASGAPQYDKYDASLKNAEVVGEGSVMLHIDAKNGRPLDYQPGHVLALEIESGQSSSLNEKNSADADKNGGWLRGPYTVSRATEDSFDILIKLVGDKSNTFASAAPGTPLKFGGKFKVPIFEGVSTETTKRVVLVSTGVGIGPCIGAIEQMLEDDDFTAKVDLFPSFRTESEIVYADYLDELTEKYPDQFGWQPVVSSKMGRLSSSKENVGMIFQADGICSTADTHYHLIGNGQLVNEWKAGLAQAGVPEEKVTVEAYFNHRAESNNDAIDNIASVVSASSMSTVSS